MMTLNVVSDLTGQNPTAFTILFAAILLAIVLFGGRSLRGTTLNAARWWSVTAVAALAAVEIHLWLGEGKGGESHLTIRYVAAIATFCPMMAVLGAKRPQHGAWQMIVLSLWLVLALPAAESYFVRRGAEVQIHDARGWFLWVLLGTGCLNYLGTRHGLAAVSVTAGQVVLLGPHLPLWRGSLGPCQVALGMGLFLAAALLVVFRSRPQSDDPEKVWRYFRDGWGTFWTLRVAERFNAHAKVNGWQYKLGYHGFLDLDGTPLPATREISAAAQRLLRSLLSRFLVVDPQDVNPEDPNAPT